MARKRTFSNRGGGASGTRRPRLSYGELEQRRRESESRSSARKPPPREMSAADPRGGAGTKRTGAHRVGEKRAPGRRPGKGPTGLHVAVGVICVLVILIPLWLFIFVLPSPIGGLTPSSGACVKNGTVKVQATISKSFDPQKVTLKVDGKDVGTSLQADKKSVSASLPLTDGKHNASIVLASGGLMGKRAATWAFTVDSTAPKLNLTKKTIKDIKGSAQAVTVDLAGTVDKDATVTVEDKSVPVGKNGVFAYATTSTRVKSLKVAAKDPAGNEATDYVITQKAPLAKGVHVSIFIAGSDNDLTKMIALTERTELNALEVDLKDEAGMIGFNLDYPLAKQAKATTNYIDLESVVDQMRFKNIYAICRIVSFKDPKLAKTRPDLTVQDKSTGRPWGTGAWLDPYSREVWDYDLAAAEAAARAGFNEIQFDYCRFPSDGNTSTCKYPHQDARPPAQVIDDFLSYARTRLSPYNAFISADLFGLTASAQGDMNIGQRVADLANRIDFISPMVYPSHYNLGEYNIKVPEANPNDIVTKSLEDFKKKIAGKPAKLRPWLQDFSLKIRYSPDMVRAQIDACEKLGIHQWLLWDPDCTYSEAALETQKK